MRDRRNARNASIQYVGNVGFRAPQQLSGFTKRENLRAALLLGIVIIYAKRCRRCHKLPSRFRSLLVFAKWSTALAGFVIETAARRTQDAPTRLITASRSRGRNRFGWFAPSAGWRIGCGRKPREPGTQVRIPWLSAAFRLWLRSMKGFLAESWHSLVHFCFYLPLGCMGVYGASNKMSRLTRTLNLYPAGTLIVG